MCDGDRASSRKKAEEYVDLARITTDPSLKQLLLERAQEWLKRAYSEGDAAFKRVLSAFNKERLEIETEIHPSIQRMPMEQKPVQQQPVQQQQSKSAPDDDGFSAS
jgi:hypothetical protein